jgi:hypothetical protein
VASFLASSCAAVVVPSHPSSVQRGLLCLAPLLPSAAAPECAKAPGSALLCAWPPSSYPHRGMFCGHILSLYLTLNLGRSRTIVSAPTMRETARTVIPRSARGTKPEAERSLIR